MIADWSVPCGFIVLALIIPSKTSMCTLEGAVSAVAFLSCRTVWAEKSQSITDAASLNTFGQNEIEVAPISSALLRIACLVIQYKTCRVPDQELVAGMCRLALDYLSKMKIAVVVRQLDLGHTLWCGRVVRVERAHRVRVVRGVQKMPDVVSGVMVSIPSGFTSAILSWPFSKTNRSDPASLITVPGSLALSK